MKDFKTLVKEYSEATGITAGYAEKILSDAIESGSSDVSAWNIPGGSSMVEKRASLIEDIDSHVDGTFDDVTLTFNITPEDAVAVIKVTSPETAKVSGNVVKVNAGETVEYTITAEGYEDKSGSEKVDSTKSISVELTKKQVTLTLNITPAGSTILFDDEPSEGNSKTVDYGSDVKYKVSLEGYKTVEATESNLTETKTVDITLEAEEAVEADAVEDEGAGMIKAN